MPSCLDKIRACKECGQRMSFLKHESDGVLKLKHSHCIGNIFIEIFYRLGSCTALEKDCTFQVALV
uniref:Uncharacterized protein n=1 Tax=Romanomermis culicivorax TaxID=13658 RepID=A0A915I9B0_ROMCU